MAARIIFSHGNSFPASTYRVIFENLRQRGFVVDAIEKFGHDPQYPVTNNWPHLVQQLADFAREKQRQYDTGRGTNVTAGEARQSSLSDPVMGEPAFLVGHSLGGILSLMCAARHPELARGVVLIDSPVLGGWRATTLGLAKRTPLIGALSPGRISQKRRNHWPSIEAALDNFQHKKSFAHWDPQVLRDYIAHGTHVEGGQRVLSFDRDIETAIYNSLPHKLDSLLKRKPLKCPAAFIGGTHSAEMRQAGTDLTHQVVKGRIMMLDGSHLFPMEKPIATAAAIEATLRNFGF
jgi:pimeloyl-ACP methyl ester carboxylesterase